MLPEAATCSHILMMPLLIVVVLFIIVELQWIAGYRYYTKFIESGVMLAEILQLLAIFNLKYDRK